MKKMIIAFMVLVFSALVSQTMWAGESFEKVYSDENVDAYKYHKTSFFGRDLVGVTIVGKQQSQPSILRLQYGSTTTSETTTTFSRCKERKEGRLTQAYFVGEKKKVSRTNGFQDAVNPANGQPPWTTTVGGDGYSTGNLAVPALFLGAGNALQGVAAPETKIITSGGNMIQGQTTHNKLVGINKNTNINPINIKNKATVN